MNRISTVGISFKIKASLLASFSKLTMLLFFLIFSNQIAGFCQNPVFDLALRKTPGVTQVKEGSTVTFSIEVFNQGEVAATQVQLVDYIPTGCILQDENWRLEDGKAFLKTPISRIDSGYSVIRTITLLVQSGSGSKIVNAAEISSAKGASGEELEDIDSLFDTDASNDGTPKDDEIDEKATEGGDEDDHDIAEVLVVQPARIGGLIWNDSNANGVKETGEAGMRQVALVLQDSTGTVLNSTASDSTGMFTFPGLSEGEYLIAITKPQGYKFTGGDVDAVTGKTLPVVVKAGDNISDLLIGLAQTVQICEDSLIAKLPTRAICAEEEFLASFEFQSGADVLWFTDPVDGEPFRVSHSGTQVKLKLSESAQFYFKSANEGCDSPRVPFSFFIQPKPARPVTIPRFEICEDSVATLSELIQQAPDQLRNTFSIYTDSLRTNVADSLLRKGVYFVFQESIYGCVSEPQKILIGERNCDPEQEVDLSLVKDANKRTVTLNEEVEYTISVKNSSNRAATNVVVEDKLPQGLSFISSDDFILSSGVLSLTIDSVSANSVKQYKYKARAIKTGSIINYAEITKSDQPDPNSTPGNGVGLNEDDDDDETIWVSADSSSATADLSLKKTANKTSVIAGGNVIYTIAVTNSGPNYATNVVVRDSLPVGLTLVKVVEGEFVTVTGKKVEARFDSLAVNGTASFKIEARLDSIGQITNRAEIISSDQKDPDSRPGTGNNEDDDDTVTISVLQECNTLSSPVISSNRNHVCKGDVATLVAIGCSNVVWSTGQTGTSIQVTPEVNTIYTASCVSGSCKGPSSTNLLISISSTAKPTVTASVTSVCFGQESSLTVTGCSEGVEWSNGQTAASIIVRPEVTTSYTATCKGGSCAGNISNSVQIVVQNQKPSPPVALNFIQNVCPETSVNMNRAVTSIPTGATLVFKNGILPESTDADSIITREGLYYVFARYPGGCLSDPASVTVAIVECEGQERADLALTLTTDKNAGSVGDTLSFTAVVKNNGPSAASQIRLSNNLGRSFQVVGSDTLNAKMEWNIGQLASGASDTLKYKLIALSEGVYQYELEASSVVTDPFPVNNKASVMLNITGNSACIASSLFADTTKLDENAYLLTLTTLISNCGNSNLSSVTADLDLSDLISDPLTAVIQGEVVTDPGSSLIINSAYNGTSNLNLLTSGSTLDVGDVDTVIVKFRIVPNGVNQRFLLNTVVSGEYSNGSKVSDVSNNGKSIIKDSDESTPVRFDTSYGFVSIMDVKESVLLDNGRSRVTLRAIFRNGSPSTISNILVSDTLSKYFPAPVKYAVTSMKATGGLKLNTDFDGSEDFLLTTAESFLISGATDTLEITLELRDTDTAIYYNQLVTSGNIGSNIVKVLSHWTSNINEVGDTPTKIVLGDIITKEDYCIGMGLAATERVWQQNGSVNVTYTAVIRNCGLKELSGISICDLITEGISDSATVTLVGSPVLGTGSRLVLNPEFDGLENSCLLNSALSYLDSSATDTLRYTVNIVPHGEKAVKSLTVKSMVDTTVLTQDISNDGLNPARAGSIPTVVMLDSTFSTDMVGLAKKLESIVRVNPAGDIYDLKFKFTVKNYSDSPISNLQIQDDLEAVFGDSVEIGEVKFTNIPENWTINPDFTGKSGNVNLLIDSLSVLSGQNHNSLQFLVRITLKSLNRLKFENSGLVIGVNSNAELPLEDISTDGDNPDANLSGSPADDLVSTAIDFTGYYQTGEFIPLGVAKSGLAELTTSGGTRITYRVIVKNYGDIDLESLELHDDLGRVFNRNTQFVVLTKPVVNKGSELIANADFNGTTLTNLLLEGSRLAVGKQDTVIFSVGVFNESEESQTYRNQIVGVAQAGDEEVVDLSVSGDDPDADGDGNPGNDSGFTINIVDPGVVDSVNVYIVVPEGLSPNGDGINDVLIIKDEAGKVGMNQMGVLKLEIFNRWGHMVYRSEDYALDYSEGKGWAGNANVGVMIGSKTELPVGTYYYSISSSDLGVLGGLKKVGFITLMR